MILLNFPCSIVFLVITETVKEKIRLTFANDLRAPSSPNRSVSPTARGVTLSPIQSPSRPRTEQVITTTTQHWVAQEAERVRREQEEKRKQKEEEEKRAQQQKIPKPASTTMPLPAALDFLNPSAQTNSNNKRQVRVKLG